MNRVVVFVVAILFVFGFGCDNVLKEQITEVLGRKMDMSLVKNDSRKIKLAQYIVNQDGNCSICQANTLYTWVRSCGFDENMLDVLFIVDSLRAQDDISVNADHKYYANVPCDIFYIDRDKLFYDKHEWLLHNPQFRTFVLDKDDNVVMVGNPVTNKQINSLFISTINNMLAHDGIYVPDEKN